MVHKRNVAFIINIITNTYESYSTDDFDSMIPPECREEYELKSIGSTSSGLVGYVNCFGINTDAVIKLTLN